jgi:copper chaperone NosL
MSLKKYKRNIIVNAGMNFILCSLLFSCTTNTQPLQLGKDNCNYCTMTISDARFGSELITAKGKVYKFDDIYCMLSFIKAGSVDTAKSRVYLVDFTSRQLQPPGNMFILKSDALHTPMQGNMAAFTQKENLDKAQKEFGGNILTWNEVLHPQ